VIATEVPVPRRELLLEVAAELFAARGFHDVGIDDIGAAAGISGPGVYRHFASKAALLEALCDRALTELLEGAHQAASHEEPRLALEALVDLHVAFAVGRHELLGVWAREQRALPEQVRRALRRRQRAYEQPWREVLAPLRADLTPDEVAVAVRATLTMLNSTARYDAPVGPDRLRALLRQLALAALLVRPEHPETPVGAVRRPSSGR